MDRESTRMLLQQWTFSIHRMHRHDSIYAAPAFVCLFQQWRIEISEKYDHSIALSSDGINYMLYMFDGNEDLFTFVSCFNWNFTDSWRSTSIECVYTRMLSLDKTARWANKKNQILWSKVDSELSAAHSSASNENGFRVFPNIYVDNAKDFTS